MSEGRIHYERTGPVGRVVFDNPKAHNALSFDMWRDLGALCERIARERDVRVVTFRGAGGKSFISGTDISDFLGFSSGQDGVEYERRVGSYIDTIEALPMSTVAVIDGWAVGGGLAIACACDFRVATPTAKFGSPIGRTIGNCLSMKGYARLVQHVGVSWAKRILVLGEMLSAAQLKEFGLVLEVVEADRLDAYLDELCATLLDSAPLTAKSSKEAIRRLMFANLPDIDDLIAEVYGSRDFRMGVRNFMDKKPRDWTGD
jgi:enoyl-CoA hydratase/carnithine racemase